MSLKRIKNIVENLNESSIDFPHKKLSPDVWVYQNNEFILRDDIRTRIIEALKAYPKYDLIGLCRDIYIIGSITSNTYDDNSDVDIHIIPKLNKIPNEDSLSFTKKVMKWYKSLRDSEGWYAGVHPFEVYVEFDEASDLNSVGVYSVLQNKWIKKPKLQSLKYNPYDIFKDIFSSIEDITKDTDCNISQLRRDLIDYKYLRKILKQVPPPVKVKLKNTLELKLKSMEDEIESLVLDKKSWKETRRRYDANTFQWEKDNAQYKILARYLYQDLISDLEDLIEDRELQDSDIGKIEGYLQDFMKIQ